MKKIFALSLALVLVLSLVPVHALAVEDGLRYQFGSVGGELYAVITGYTGTAEELTIPDTINGYPVREIAKQAFLKCTTLVRVVLPDTITTIGESAFQGCTALTEINIPSGLTDMGWFLFFDCTALKNVTIPEGLTKISYGMFHGCKSLTTVTIPDGVTLIDSYAFSGCTGLVDVTIPNGVKCIGNHTFYGCKNLKTVTIPESVTFIDYNAFRECKKLESVTIPASVTEIGSWAFAGCTKLAEVWFRGDAPKLGERVFLGDTAAVWYPQNNDTWNEDVMRNQGGKLTWTAYVPRPFDDVPVGAWYEGSLLWAMDSGITSGLTATEFGPGTDCNRAHVVTFLWRAAGCPEPASTEHPFVDVKEGDFYYKAVLWAVENGVTNGVDATHFGATKACNRAQVVTFLYRAMGNPEITTESSPFTDVQAGQWYVSPILWAVENGITNGMSADTFGVDTTCNRAQVVTFLYRTYVD